MRICITYITISLKNFEITSNENVTVKSSLWRKVKKHIVSHNTYTYTQHAYCC